MNFSQKGVSPPPPTNLGRLTCLHVSLLRAQLSDLFCFSSPRPRRRGFLVPSYTPSLVCAECCFQMTHKIIHRTVKTHTHLFQASISSSCRQTSLSSFRHSIISACRRPANGRNTTSFTTHPRSSTALLTTSPWEMLSLKSARGFARPMIRPGERWGSVTISGSEEGVGNFAPFLLDGTQMSSSDSGSVSLSSPPFVGIGGLAAGAV